MILALVLVGMLDNDLIAIDLIPSDYSRPNQDESGSKLSSFYLMHMDLGSFCFCLFFLKKQKPFFFSSCYYCFFLNLVVLICSYLTSQILRDVCIKDYAIFGKVYESPPFFLINSQIFMSIIF